MNGVDLLEVVRRLSGARFRIRLWSKESNALKWPMLTLIESDKREQRAEYDVSKFAARDGRRLGPPVTEVDRCWAVTRAEARTVRELSMSGVMKKANFGLKQHGVGVCTFGQMVECREIDGESGFF